MQVQIVHFISFYHLLFQSIYQLCCSPRWLFLFCFSFEKFSCSIWNTPWPYFCSPQYPWSRLEEFHRRWPECRVRLSICRGSRSLQGGCRWCPRSSWSYWTSLSPSSCSSSVSWQCCWCQVLCHLASFWNCILLHNQLEWWRCWHWSRSKSGHGRYCKEEGSILDFQVSFPCRNLVNHSRNHVLHQCNLQRI